VAKAIRDIHPIAIIAALASSGAGAIHLAVMPDHLTDWWADGVFFGALGICQIGWAAASLPVSTPRLLLFGLVAHAGSMLTWVLSRTVGLPFGPTAGGPEPTGLTDLVAVVLETMVCVTIAVLLHRRPRTTLTRPVAVGTTVAAAAVIAGLTLPALSAASSHQHGGPGHAAHHEGTELGHHNADHADTASKAGSPDPRLTAEPDKGSHERRRPSHHHGSGTAESAHDHAHTHED
jgi:hypothetical protein